MFLYWIFNNTDDILSSFKPYYELTEVSSVTNPNISNNVCDYFSKLNLIENNKFDIEEDYSQKIMYNIF